MKQQARRPGRRPCRESQRGGTFIGLVLGLVFGLGIALAVAVYVTKVPVPFVNKAQSRSGEQDAAEAKKNKDWDPNALIQGKNPARAASGPVAAASTPEAPSSAPADAPASSTAATRPTSVVTAVKAEPKSDAKADAKLDVKGDAKPDAKADAKVDTKAIPKAEPATDAKKTGSTVDPLGELAKAKSGNAPLDPFTYMVQTGAFRTPEDAEAQRVRLMLMGVEVKVSEREQSGRMVFRVRSGPFERKEDAEKARDKLEVAGFEAVLVRIQR